MKGKRKMKIMMIDDFLNAVFIFCSPLASGISYNPREIIISLCHFSKKFACSSPDSRDFYFRADNDSIGCSPSSPRPSIPPLWASDGEHPPPPLGLTSNALEWDAILDSLYMVINKRIL
jgi:hypothetical protein